MALSLANAAFSTTTAELGASDLTINVASTSAFPTAPFVITLLPASGTAQYEFVEIASKTATTLVASALGKRYQSGSSAGSGLVWASGSRVRLDTTAQWADELRTDVNAKVAAAHTHTGGADGSVVAHSSLSGLTSGDPHTQYALKAGATFSGTLAMADNLITQALLKDYGEEVNAIGTVTTALAINLESGNIVTATLGGNPTATIANPPATGKAGSFTLVLTQDGTGSRAVTWPASVKWAGGTAPTLSTAAGAVDILTFVTVNAGTTWYGFAAGIRMA